ncbi:uncharacterized protein I303_102328 [Kwoniella dejecticola CBS 10117]|uniref:Uncharacterized protein n=1 Tax=Kwoniella dejecticola CBS 10117 TaxID=1296121 RepID=A0A1A6AB96_9TREE|nr:uncharacterized protein I303_01531 [Kwoniella dejecticola CBS 10117]OBR87329.1 hypothetical protein I303_01531 [Kwoniella dejecticola CBS 10117]
MSNIEDPEERRLWQNVMNSLQDEPTELHNAFTPTQANVGQMSYEPRSPAPGPSYRDGDTVDFAWTTWVQDNPSSVHDTAADVEIIDVPMLDDASWAAPSQMDTQDTLPYSESSLPVRHFEQPSLSNVPLGSDSSTDTQQGEADDRQHSIQAVLALMNNVGFTQTFRGADESRTLSKVYDTIAALQANESHSKLAATRPQMVIFAEKVSTYQPDLTLTMNSIVRTYYWTETQDRSLEYLHGIISPNCPGIPTKDKVRYQRVQRALANIRSTAAGRAVDLHISVPLIVQTLDEVDALFRETPNLPESVEHVKQICATVYTVTTMSQARSGADSLLTNEYFKRLLKIVEDRKERKEITSFLESMKTLQDPSERMEYPRNVKNFLARVSSNQQRTATSVTAIKNEMARQESMCQSGSAPDSIMPVKAGDATSVKQEDNTGTDSRVATNQTGSRGFSEEASAVGGMSDYSAGHLDGVDTRHTSTVKTEVQSEDPKVKEEEE